MQDNYAAASYILILSTYVDYVDLSMTGVGIRSEIYIHACVSIDIKSRDGASVDRF